MLAAAQFVNVGNSEVRRSIGSLSGEMYARWSNGIGKTCRGEEMAKQLVTCESQPNNVACNRWYLFNALICIIIIIVIDQMPGKWILALKDIYFTRNGQMLWQLLWTTSSSIPSIETGNYPFLQALINNGWLREGSLWHRRNFESALFDSMVLGQQRKSSLVEGARSTIGGVFWCYSCSITASHELQMVSELS